MRLINITSILISLIIFASGPAWSAEFSKKEKEALFGPNSELITTCQREIQALEKTLFAPDKFPPQMAQLLKWTSGMIDPSEYCTCVVDRVSTKLTPDMLKNISQEDGRAMGRLAGQECVLAKMQSQTSGFCAALMSDVISISPPGAWDEKKMPEVCSCMQDRFNKLTPPTFDKFFKFTPVDYSAYINSGLSPDTDTLNGSLIQCGFLKMKKPQ
ncbi:hypothetical protein ACO0LD_28290 [Undibacterium sp. Ji83W]|uniref:hypothetical protein n=1 Tax=Undibacterium sp. Ji83W TaxID=3413043 RepID=UPI003BF22FF7